MELEELRSELEKLRAEHAILRQNYEDQTASHDASKQEAPVSDTLKAGY